MRSRLALTLSALILALTASATFAQTTNVLDGGININEFLPDPNGTANCDTDGSGTANTTDEFVELHNNSGSAINIGGYQIWDAGVGNWFTFPGGTMVDAGGFALVVVGVQAGGSLPAVAPGSVAFDAGDGGGALNNGGDNVVVYDPVNDEYIQAIYTATRPMIRQPTPVSRRRRPESAPSTTSATTPTVSPDPRSRWQHRPNPAPKGVPHHLQPGRHPVLAGRTDVVRHRVGGSCPPAPWSTWPTACVI